MHNLIEGHLSGADASVSGLLQLLDRHARRGTFVRVELQLCPGLAMNSSIAAIRLAVERWLRGHNMLPAAVSIRVRAAAVSARTGQHRVRLYLTDRRGPAEDDLCSLDDSAPSWWRRMMSSHWPARRAGSLASASPRPGGLAALSLREARQLLGAAVIRAALRESAAGRSGPWSGVRVVARAMDLAMALQPVKAELDAEALARDLRRRGHDVTSPFLFELRLGTFDADEGTAMPHEHDLEVVLSATNRPGTSYRCGAQP